MKSEKIKSLKKNQNKTSSKSKVKIPLRIIDKSKKKYHYKIADPFKERKKAIHDGIRMEIEDGKNFKKAVISKKARFNVLRIYRKNSKNKQKQQECKTLTDDMIYMNKLIYEKWQGKTKNICQK